MKIMKKIIDYISKIVNRVENIDIISFAVAMLPCTSMLLFVLSDQIPIVFNGYATLVWVLLVIAFILSCISFIVLVYRCITGKHVHRKKPPYRVLTPEGKYISIDEYMGTDDYKNRL